MHIEENKVFIFKFPYENTDFAIPVRANTKEEAVRRLQGWMQGVMTELAMEVPQVANISVPQNAMAAGAIPPEVLEMRIDTLLKDLGAGGLADTAKVQTVKNFTKLVYEPKNYPKIITKLEEMVIKNGEKED